MFPVRSVTYVPGLYQGDLANKAVEPTPNSLRSCLAPAIGRGSPPAFAALADGRTAGSSASVILTVFLAYRRRS